MEKKATFYAKVNANNAITIQEATREKLGLVKGDIVRITIGLESKPLAIQEQP